MLPHPCPAWNDEWQHMFTMTLCAFQRHRNGQQLGRSTPSKLQQFRDGAPDPPARCRRQQPLSCRERAQYVRRGVAAGTSSLRYTQRSTLDTTLCRCGRRRQSSGSVAAMTCSWLERLGPPPLAITCAAGLHDYSVALLPMRGRYLCGVELFAKVFDDMLRLPTLDVDAFLRVVRRVHHQLRLRSLLVRHFQPLDLVGFILNEVLHLGEVTNLSAAHHQLRGLEGSGGRLLRRVAAAAEAILVQRVVEGQRLARRAPRRRKSQLQTGGSHDVRPATEHGRARVSPAAQSSAQATRHEAADEVPHSSRCNPVSAGRHGSTYTFFDFLPDLLFLRRFFAMAGSRAPAKNNSSASTTTRRTDNTRPERPRVPAKPDADPPQRATMVRLCSLSELRAAPSPVTLRDHVGAAHLRRAVNVIKSNSK